MSAPRISANLLPGPPEEWVANGYLPLASYPMRTTDYYASLIQSASPHDPIARQCVPRVEEENLQGEKDPLGELGKEPVPGLLHVYPDRALLLATDTCAVNCRHCNRRWNRGAAGYCRSPVLQIGDPGSSQRRHAFFGSFKQISRLQPVSPAT